MRNSLIFSLIVLTGSLKAQSGQELHITGSLVNIREAPSIDTPVLFRLSQGRSVMELGRKGEWIQIQLDHNAGETGWIHQSLVTPATIVTDNLRQSETPETHEFETFLVKFEDLNLQVRREHDFVPFLRAKSAPDHTVILTATPDWFIASQEMRETILSQVFELWDDIVETGLSITVQVVNEENEYHMLMFR